MVKNSTRTAPSAPALDFGSLAVADAEMPKQGRDSKAASTPFPGWLRESKESGKAKRVTVPGANVAEVVYMVRASANMLKIGSRVVIQDGKGNTVKNAKDCQPRASYTVTFIGKNRKKSRKDATATATAE